MGNLILTKSHKAANPYFAEKLGINIYTGEELSYFIYNYYMLQMKGWLTFFIAPATYVRMLLIGVVSYFVVSAVQYLRIRRIPMEQALKNNE